MEQFEYFTLMILMYSNTVIFDAIDTFAVIASACDIDGAFSFRVKVLYGIAYDIAEYLIDKLFVTLTTRQLFDRVRKPLPLGRWRLDARSLVGASNGPADQHLRGSPRSLFYRHEI